MPQEEPVSRKNKKALRDAERQKKGKKRKRQDAAEPDALPAQDDEIADVDNVAVEAAKPVKKESKKRKADTEVVKEEGAEGAEDGAGQPKKKKRRKAKSAEDKPSKNRFIVFVGNLPYKTTDSSLQKHFGKLQPFTLRHRTDPKTKKSKGFAFLEFENYDRMKTCLKLYHHSMFDPEALERGEAPIDPEKQPQGEDTSVQRGGRKKKETARRINVELTAGGGGTTDARKEKIKEKNVRLEEQRQRRAELERKEKEKERKEGGGKKPARRVDTAEKVEESGQATNGATQDTHGINPARLAMINR